MNIRHYTLFIYFKFENNTGREQKDCYHLHLFGVTRSILSEYYLFGLEEDANYRLINGKVFRLRYFNCRMKDNYLTQVIVVKLLRA